MLKDLLRTAALTPADLTYLLDLADRFRENPHAHSEALAGETVVLYFNKPSTRTRLSMATAAARLGAVPMVVGPTELQLGRGETIEDTAHVIERYARLFTIRTFSDDDVARFAAAASIPVVNALTDGHHPCQSLADLQTLRRKKGDLAATTLAYVGDGNNVCHSLLEAAALAGMTFRVATPPDYTPDADVVALARSLARDTGATLHLTTDPAEAVDGADAVYTDTWVSMGEDAQREAKLAAFRPYQVNSALMARARPDAIVLHCLPQHRGEEITGEVVDGPQSVVFDQAENRLHTAAALFHALVGGLLKGRT